MSKLRRRLLGMTFNGQPIFEPNPAASGIVYAAMGGGKTTSVAIPAVQSIFADRECAICINDVKDGEIAHQIAEMCIKHGRKFAVVDDLRVMGKDYPYRIELNAFSQAQTVAQTSPEQLPFIIEGISNALIEEPPKDQRNFYWRESPRELTEYAYRVLLKHNLRLATPGGLQSFMADSHSWNSALELEADDPDSELSSGARDILDMRSLNPEHYVQHMRAALNALKVFSFGSLRDAGRSPDITHEELLRDNWVVCFVAPVRYAERLGPYYAQHFLSLLKAQLTGTTGRACLILDEFCNAPLKEAVNKITVFRAYGLKCLYITQSRQDVVRKYGERETAILEENCAVKQWLRFSDFEEAERVSKAIGDGINVSHGLGLNSDRFAYSGNFSTGKDRLFTPFELMNLPEDEQIIHVNGVGFIHARKIRQNEIAPYCFDLAPNPLEGGRLPPDPKVTLTV